MELQLLLLAAGRSRGTGTVGRHRWGVERQRRIAEEGQLPVAAAAQEEEEGYVARVSQVLEGSSIYTEWAQHRPSNCKSTGRDDWAGWAVYSLRENSLDARFLARLLLFLHFSTN